MFRFARTTLRRILSASSEFTVHMDSTGNIQCYKRTKISLIIFRTGFLICAFLIEELEWSVDMAVNSFTAARAPGINKEDYLKDIYKRYAGVEKEASKKAAAAEQQLSALGSDIDSVSKTLSVVTLEQKKERKTSTWR